MITRRRFLGMMLGSAVTMPIGTAAYGMMESGQVEITRPIIAVRNLPRSFDGLRIALIADVHHGPFLPQSLVYSVARTTMALKPDLILLGGDYIHRGAQFAEPCFEALAHLAAPMGVFGVLGNHDYVHGVHHVRTAMKRAGITELTNAGHWLQRENERVYLAGMDDLWHGRPQLEYLANVGAEDCILMLCHNPDYVEKLKDRRIGLVFSGHTHGGQFTIPGMANPFVPSRYGMKYAKGLVQAPQTQVYVSRGIGMSVVPSRINCPPELSLITLHRG